MGTVPVVFVGWFTFMSIQETMLREQIDTLYTDNQTWLQAWLNNKLGCSHRASDLLHDTFVRLLVRTEPIKDTYEPKTYLLTVAKRVLIDHWRREEVEKTYLEALLQVPEQYALNPEEQHIFLETLLEISNMLNGLAPIVKSAFLFAQLEGMKNAEIAKALNISISTVKRYQIQAAAQCYFSIQEQS